MGYPFDITHSAADEIKFMDDLLDRGRFDVLENYTAIILNDQRSWDPTVDVGRVKAYAKRMRTRIHGEAAA